MSGSRSVTVGSGRACGKVILFGEHAVVHGVPAIAAGIERGAEASATRVPSGASTLALGDRSITADPTGNDDLARAFAALLEGCPSAVHVEALTDLPPGGGLGCSAALGVAIGRAVSALEDEDEDRALVRATAWEGIFHGNPSGVDTAAAALGGCLRFVRGEGVARVAPARDLWLAVGSSGVSSSTKVMVDGVARIRERQPEAFAKALEAFRSLVDNARLAIEAGDLRGIGSLMDLAQMLLSGWMLSTETLEDMCRTARDAGALGAKLTGAGGGGCVIALADDVGEGGGEAAASRIARAWEREGFSSFATRIAQRGHAASIHLRRGEP